MRALTEAPLVRNGTAITLAHDHGPSAFSDVPERSGPKTHSPSDEDDVTAGETQRYQQSLDGESSSPQTCSVGCTLEEVAFEGTATDGTLVG